MRPVYLILVLCAVACHAPEVSESQFEANAEFVEGSQDASWILETNTDTPGTVWSIKLEVSRPIRLLRLANGEVISLAGENLCAEWAQAALQEFSAASEKGDEEMEAAAIENFLREAIVDPRAEVRVSVSQRKGHYPGRGGLGLVDADGRLK